MGTGPTEASRSCTPDTPARGGGEDPGSGLPAEPQGLTLCRVSVDPESSSSMVPGMSTNWSPDPGTIDLKTLFDMQ